MPARICAFEVPCSIFILSLSSRVFGDGRRGRRPCNLQHEDMRNDFSDVRLNYKLLPSSSQLEFQ